jgi:hypothetical protein
MGDPKKKLIVCCSKHNGWELPFLNLRQRRIGEDIQAIFKILMAICGKLLGIRTSGLSKAE